MDFDGPANGIKLHVSHLQIGMFVSQLDCDWLDTPFLLQGFLIESEADIDKLCEHCEHVWVDANIQHATGKVFIRGVTFDVFGKRIDSIKR